MLSRPVLKINIRRFVFGAAFFLLVLIVSMLSFMVSAYE